MKKKTKEQLEEFRQTLETMASTLLRIENQEEALIIKGRIIRAEIFEELEGVVADVSNKIDEVSKRQEDVITSLSKAMGAMNKNIKKLHPPEKVFCPVGAQHEIVSTKAINHRCVNCDFRESIDISDRDMKGM